MRLTLKTKRQMKTLRLIGTALLAVVMCVNFAACSDDNEGNASDNLQEIIVGVWAQDGDNDIFVLNADGTGIVYGDETLYKNDEDGDSFTWTYSNGWVYGGVPGIQEEELRAESVSTNKIVWRRYRDYDTGSKDVFGWYDYWIWERYTK